jgi:2'-5' RNA ligase
MMGSVLPSTPYSLWLQPAGGVYRRWAVQIRRLSRECATPAFEPHITLLGGLRGPKQAIVAKCSRLARCLPPLVVRLTEADYLDEYFRCLFVRVAMTDTLLRANEAAREIFGQREPRAFTPHLSLIYGNLSVEEKEAILARLGRRFDITFVARRLHLYVTADEPRRWRAIETFDLA